MKPDAVSTSVVVKAPTTVPLALFSGMLASLSAMSVGASFAPFTVSVSAEAEVTPWLSCIV